MVGIENDDKELEGAQLSSEALNNIFENIIRTLSHLNTEEAEPGEQQRSRRSPPALEQSQAYPPHVSDSLEHNSDEGSENFSDESCNPTMTILPKKKAHKERSDQRDHRHHAGGHHDRVHGMAVPQASSQASGYSHQEYGPEGARHPHGEIDHRSTAYLSAHGATQRHGNAPTTAANDSALHGHRHTPVYTQQQLLNEGITHTMSVSENQMPFCSHMSYSFPDMPASESYKLQGPSASCSGLTHRHDRSLGSRKDRSSNQFDADSGCHSKKRCISPSFAEKGFPVANKAKLSTKTKATLGTKSQHGKIAASLPASTNQEETSNSDDNNSEDEYYGNITRKTIEDEEKFARLVEKKGWCIKQMAGDGACLFRAVADQVYGDQEMHDEVRNNCLNYMSKNADHFSQYVTEEFSKYIARKRSVSCHGNHLEIQALAEVYNRPIEIYYYDIEPRNVFHGDYKTDYPPIRLSYHGSVHYNSIREPYSATVGIGLGLPEFEPGLADKKLMAEAVKRSEDCEIEEAMLKDKLKDSDWDVMQAQIEDQIAHESYNDWVKAKQDGVAGSRRSSRSPPAAACAQSLAAADVPDLGDFLPPEMSDWDENAILAHALAESTLEYYDSLRSAFTDRPGCSKDS